ncbi:cell division protein [Limosilactobacillus sp. STM2_1]|uniref:Cell division protein n=1 Tax=Limosilactobacillus rudii TaxID=2759755 RepID=A0A7W3UMV9_9LACO|nr:cell division protein [Limosilactobacillus rudii]MBB1080441.1 cell division protein [Limosilactobacillus rudii]MBB1098467.1 cell division protein [Limosilactobacillus rudii]MCD7135475.1 cell division protein [Limosilactobacillus rudii]
MKSKIANLINWGLPYCAIIAMAYLIMFPQIVSHGVILGTDSIFHFNRFYDAAKQVQQFNFNYFQSNYSFQQSGRIINAVYGPLFAYLNGIILGIVGTWYRYQIVTTFLVYFIGGVGMYRLGINAHSKRFFATICALIYMNIGWLPRWELAQNMNAWGAALAPFMVICGIRMIQNHQRPINWLQLMILMTVVIQIHILSSLFFVVTLIPFFIIGMILATNRWQMWIDTIKAVFGTIILTANVWGALLMLNVDNDIATPAKFNLLNNALQPAMFNSTRDYLIYAMWILFILQLIYVLFTLKNSLTNTVLTILGTLMLLFSSIFTPWNIIQKIFPMLGHTLQFPNRLTIIAYPLLLAGVAISMTTITQNSNHPVLCNQLTKGFLMLLLFLVFSPTTIDVYARAARYDSEVVLNSFSAITRVSDDKAAIRHSVHDLYPGQLLTMVEKRSPDYLPIPKKYLNQNYVRSYAYERQIINESRKYTHTVLKHGGLELTWTAKTAQKVRLPIITYKESILTVNGHRLRHYQRSSVGAPYVDQQPGKNTVTLYFKQATWFTILLTISLSGLFILSLYGLYYFCTHLKNYFDHIMTGNDKDNLKIGKV